MSKAEEILADIVAQYPDAEVAVREEKSLKFFLGAQKSKGAFREEYLWVGSVGELHYSNGREYKDFKGIIQPDDAGDGFSLRVEIGGFLLQVRSDGSRRLYPRADNAKEYLNLGVPVFFEKDNPVSFEFTSFEVEDSAIIFHADGANLVISISARRVKTDLVLLDDRWSGTTTFRFPFELVGYTLSGTQLVSESQQVTVGTLPALYASDAKGRGSGEKGESKGVPDLASDGSEITLDMRDWVFPVMIDPTVNLSIGVYNDDGHYDDSGEAFSFRPDALIHYFGITPGTRSAWLRYTGVAIANAATVTAATIDFLTGSDTDTGSVNVDIKGNNVDSATAPTSNSDGRSKARTGASVNWVPVGWGTAGVTESSPDISSIVQEIFDRAGWASGNALMILIDRVNTGATAYRSFQSYDSGAGNVAILNITYSTVVPRVIGAICT